MAAEGQSGRAGEWPRFYGQHGPAGGYPGQSGRDRVREAMGVRALREPGGLAEPVVFSEVGARGRGSGVGFENVRYEIG